MSIASFNATQSPAGMHPLVERSRHTRAGLRRLKTADVEGRISATDGLAVEISGLSGFATRGDRLEIARPGDTPLLVEVVTVSATAGARAMAFGQTDGVRIGSPATLLGPARLAPGPAWLGRVLDPLGRPLDGGPPPPYGDIHRNPRSGPPPAGLRSRLGPRLNLGVRALDAFCAMRRGQRLGLFAGSGIGKSTLLSMLVRGADCDAAVICLVGERGRELREFIEEDLGPHGLARSVVVCATSDMPPLLRREAAFAAMTAAEVLADEGRHVLLLMDSVTRFALALREIGLAAGEPPATRGHTPSVFAELPRLLERAGPRAEGCAGAITGLFTVLVDGDDHDEPVADAVRGILDGHVVLDRRIGESGRWPAVDVLRSVSRTVPGCLTEVEHRVMERARRLIALHADMADMVRLGAYRPGTDHAVDEALRLVPRIETFLAQRKDDGTIGSVETFRRLAAIIEEGPHAG
jgi:flagellum-specific ATP synthase